MRLLTTAMAAALLSTPAFAQFNINIGAIMVSPDDTSSALSVVEQVASLPAGSTSATVNTNTQLGITLDYRFKPNWAVQLIAATPFSHDIQVQGSAIDGLKIGKTKHLPPTLLLQYHFSTPYQSVDPFIGLGVNYTAFFDEQIDPELGSALQALQVITPTDNVSLHVKDSVGVALQAGINYQLTESVGIHLMLSKMDIDTRARVKVNGTTIEQVNVNIDPLVTMLGLRWTW